MEVLPHVRHARICSQSVKLSVHPERGQHCCACTQARTPTCCFDLSIEGFGSINAALLYAGVGTLLPRCDGRPQGGVEAAEGVQEPEPAKPHTLPSILRVLGLGPSGQSTPHHNGGSARMVLHDRFMRGCSPSRNRPTPPPCGTLLETSETAIRFIYTVEESIFQRHFKTFDCNFWS